MALAFLRQSSCQPGRLCFWEAHWAAVVAASASRVSGLPLDRTRRGGPRAAIRELVRAEGLRDGSWLTKAQLPQSLGHASSRRRVTTSMTRPFVDARPLIVCANCATNRRNSRRSMSIPCLAGHKTHNYMENMLLLEAARAGGYADVLRVNTAGSVGGDDGRLICFSSRDGQLVHPGAIGTGILPGVIRA